MNLALVTPLEIVSTIVVSAMLYAAIEHIIINRNK